ncbi:MAG TPA: hypothetical protein VLA00_07370 [Xanthobacteraceae bacterium]|nr:hypothetical protein [Xanthobacteraceae bacterium]
MSIRSALFAAALLLVPSLGHAAGETKMFLVDSFDGYGIDSCLASGASCGAAMAGAWCRTHDFSRAVRFGRAEAAAPVQISAPVRTACFGAGCAETVAIVCEK